MRSSFNRPEIIRSCGEQICSKSPYDLMIEGSIPSGGHYSNSSFLSICNPMENMSLKNTSNPPSYSSATETVTTENLGKRRALQFLDTMASERTPKSRRLDIVNQLQRCEKERSKLINARNRTRRQIAELYANLEEQETKIAEADERIRRLKAEKVE